MANGFASKLGTARPSVASLAAVALAGLAAVAARPAGAEVVNAGPAHAGAAVLVPAAVVVDEVPEAFACQDSQGCARSPIPPRERVKRLPEEGPLPFAFAGYFWVDTGTMDRLTNSNTGEKDRSANFMQGRMVLAATFQRPLGDYFGRAHVEFLGLVNEYAKSQYEPHTLDAYAMFGHEYWDVQIGRFLPWEVYHRGNGIELYTPEEAGAAGAPALYWLNYARDRFNEPGQAAVHVYPFDWLGFEVSSVYGQQEEQNWTGLRPVAAVHLGGFQALAGWEILKQTPQSEAHKVEQTAKGWAGRLQYDFPWLTVGANYAAGEVERTRIEGDLDSEATVDTWSAGGFGEVRFLKDHAVGFGYHHTEETNLQDETNYHDQSFVSYLYRLPFQGASVKAVYGYALGDVEDADTNSFYANDMHSFRIRLAYDLK